jgi:hypothetical protein
VFSDSIINQSDNLKQFIQWNECNFFDYK